MRHSPIKGLAVLSSFDLHKVDIVLATFNGEKYLAQQLNSVIAQTHKNWRLIVSDDGSSDSTFAILTEFSKKDPRIIIVNTQRQGGVVANFAKALSFVIADYVMFCDQDDVWLNDKLYLMLDKLMKVEANIGKQTPVLGFSDLSLVDRDLSKISPSLYNAGNLNPYNNLDYRFLLWRSTVFGCTVIFNAALYQKAMPIPSGVPMHDQWFALLASLRGKIFYVPKQTIMYRLHESNVVGGRPKTMYQKTLSINANLRNIRSATYKCSNQIKSIFGGKFINAKSIKSDLEENMYRYDINKLNERIRFLLSCVLPFWKERKIYTLLFSVFFMLKVENEN